MSLILAGAIMRPITSRWSSSLSPVRGKPPTPSSLQPAVSSQSHPTAMMPMTTPPMLCNLGKSYPNAAFQHSFSDPNACLRSVETFNPTHHYREHRMSQTVVPSGKHWWP